MLLKLTRGNDCWRRDAVVALRTSPERGFEWRYQYDEHFERMTPGSRWSSAGEWPRLISRPELCRVQVELADTFCDQFMPATPDESDQDIPDIRPSPADCPLARSGPNEFLLRVPINYESMMLRRDVLVEMRFTYSRGLEWRYVYHENCEKPTLVALWTVTDRYTLERPLARRWDHRLHLEVRDALTEHFLIADPDAPGYLVGVDRSELISMMTTYRASRMYQPRRGLAEAVDYLSSICGGDRELARLSGVANTSLHRVTNDRKGVSGISMKKLAEVADLKCEWFLAEFLRSQGEMWQRHWDTMLDGVEWGET